METTKDLNTDGIEIINYEVYPSEAENENPHTLFYDSKIKHFLAYEKYDDKNETKLRSVLIYKILKFPHELDADERERVLNYTLSSRHIDDEVTLSDIYLQGEFIKLTDKII